MTKLNPEIVIPPTYPHEMGEDVIESFHFDPDDHNGLPITKAVRVRYKMSKEARRKELQDAVADWR